MFIKIDKDTYINFDLVKAVSCSEGFAKLIFACNENAREVINTPMSFVRMEEILIDNKLTDSETYYNAYLSKETKCAKNKKRPKAKS